MKKITKTSLIAILIVLFFSSFAVAGDCGNYSGECLAPSFANSGRVGTENYPWGYGYFKYIGLNGITYTPPAADGTSGQVLATDGAGALSWAAAGAATAFDDISDPDADSTLVFGDNEILSWTLADTNEDMITIQGIGAFGDVSVMRVEQITGNPTDGTVLEVVAADANVDPLVVSSSAMANALIVGQNAGAVTMGGTLTVGGAVTLTGALTVNGATMAGDGATAVSGFIKTITAGGATGTVTLAAADSGKVYLTSQATEFDLPDAATGLEYTIVVGHASNVHLDPAAGDIILYGGASAGDRIVADAVGESVTVVGVSATQWAVTAIQGTWSDDN